MKIHNMECFKCDDPLTHNEYHFIIFLLPKYKKLPRQACTISPLSYTHTNTLYNKQIHRLDLGSDTLFLTLQDSREGQTRTPIQDCMSEGRKIDKDNAIQRMGQEQGPLYFLSFIGGLVRGSLTGVAYA